MQSQNNNNGMAVELYVVEHLDFCQQKKKNKKLNIVTLEGISLDILNFTLKAEGKKKKEESLLKNMNASDFPFNAA